jgi:hypothetical protein
MNPDWIWDQSLTICPGFFIYNIWISTAEEDINAFTSKDQKEIQLIIDVLNLALIKKADKNQSRAAEI